MDREDRERKHQAENRELEFEQKKISKNKTKTRVKAMCTMKNSTANQAILMDGNIVRAIKRKEEFRKRKKGRGRNGKGKRGREGACGRERPELKKR